MKIYSAIAMLVVVLAVIQLLVSKKRARLAKIQDEIEQRAQEQQLLVLAELDKIGNLIFSETLSPSEVKRGVYASIEVIKKHDENGAYNDTVRDALNYVNGELSKKK